jgi:hypothetical protein
VRRLPLLLLLAAIAFAQDPRGRILGRVTDPTGAVVPNVPVTAINIETQVQTAATTNEQGNYLILHLNPGRYRLSAEFSGFKRFERSEVEVRVGDAIMIDIGLEPGAMTESVTVTAETPLLQASEASVGQLVDTRRLHELPLAGGNPLYLLQLTPGIISTNASSHGWFPHALDAISNVAAVGTRTRSNQFALDGNPVMTQAGQVSYSPPPEMIQEMKIDTVPYDAALGGFSGANFNIVTKGGTNAYRGDLFFSHYSRPLTTRNFFVNRFIFDPRTGPITDEKKKSQWPPVLTNRYRASGSGPIVKNKTFLVYGFDMLDRKRPQTGNNTVPTLRQREGDFSELLALGTRYQIYDPATIRAEPGGRFSRQPFPRNIIPANRIDPVAKRLLEMFPLPNNFENPEGRNNFIAPIGTRIDYFSHSFRADHTFSDRHRMYGSVSLSNLDEPGGRRFPGLLSVGQVEDRRHRGVALDDVYLLTPATVLNVRYGFTRYLNSVSPDSKGMDLAALGFSPDLLRNIDPSTSALPEITIQGLQNLSQPSGFVSATNYHTIQGNINNTRGNHTLRFGGEARIFQENRSAFGNVAPRLDYQAAWTRGPLDNSPVAPIGQGLASFLLGLPTGGWQDLNASYAQQSRFFGLFFQDDWRLTTRFTVNLGIRYEIETPIKERYDRTVRGFDFNTENPVFAAARARYAANPIPELPVAQFRTPGGLLFSGVGGNPRTLWNSDKNNFAPRVGFAWTLTPKTVLRGGYGIFYELLGASYNDVNQQGFSQRTNVVASLDNGVTFRANTANPLPDGVLPPAGASAGLATFVGRAPGFFNPDLRNGYMQRWSFGLQRELPGRFVIEAMYVGNRGTLLGVDRDLAAVPEQYYSRLATRDQERINVMTAAVPNPFFGIPAFAGTGLANVNTTRAQLLSPYPHFTAVNTTDDIGYSWYHSFQFRADKRFSKGLTIGSSYTWSKFMEAIELLNPFDALPTEIISPQDRPHHVSVTGIYELPFFRNRTVFGGWQLQAIYQWQVGPPIGFGNVIHYGAPVKIDNPTAERWFNTEAFERDPARALEWNVRTFPLRLSNVRADGFNQWDLSVIKNFRITENLRFQLRAEAQNALNHAMFAVPNTAPANTLFGQVNATQFPEQRRIQIGGKLSF